MSAEKAADSPEPRDAGDETAAAADVEQAQPRAAAAQDAAEDAAGESPEAAGDASADEDADAAEHAEAGATADQPDSKKRRRAPRIRKGAPGKADEPAKEGRAAQPRGRARRGKAAAPKATADAPAPATTAAPRRTKPSPSGPRRRVVRARARYVRTSARKARLVCAHLQGKSVAQARAILAFAPRAVARDWSKLLESAVANAENNHELLEEDLVIREAYADEGPTIKRFRPRAMGRATPIRKRTSHLTITLQASSSQDNNKRAG
jgi:ribosomal protein L22